MRPTPGRNSASGKTNNLPLQLTSFIGREREMAEVSRLLLTTRLLTLTGAGGSGKTRLALEVAARMLKGFPGGVWLVELAALSDPALVPQAVALALGVREIAGQTLTETLINALHAKHVLVVLDNCEYLIEACARLAETLLRSCPNLRILATGREPLHIAGEVTWLVPTLSLPDPQRLPLLKDLLRYEAIRLFVERAKDVLPAFTLVEHNAAAVAQVCQRLDGLPLAIELAAARVRVLSVEQIAARLDDSLRLLVSGSRMALTRHQTLKATLDWSYDLLSGPEQVMFRRVAAFSGGFTLEAAEAICAGEGVEQAEVLDFLSQLVEKSLVVVDKHQDKELRYRLLEPIRQYSVEKLQASGEEAVVRERHRDWYLALAEEAAQAISSLRSGQQMGGGQQGIWVARLAQEYDNLRAALAWSQTETGRAEPGVRLAMALSQFWQMRGIAREGLAWLEIMLEKSRELPASMRADALLDAGFLAYHAGDFDPATAFNEEALVLYQDLGNVSGIARTKILLARVAESQGDQQRALTLAEQSLALYREVGDKWGAAVVLFQLGDIAYAQGDIARAVMLLEESLALCREVGNTWATGRRLARLGQIALAQDDLGQAARCLHEALTVCRDTGDHWGIAMSLIGLAGAAGARGEPERGARLLGAVEIVQQGLATVMWLMDRAEYRRILATIRAALGEERFAAAWAEGQAMSLEDAIAYAQAATEPAPVTASLSSPSIRPTPLEPAGLTEREIEVLRLIAMGKSNQEIAGELVLSIRTVERHISNIYEKIGIYGKAARAAATAYALSHGLITA